MSIQHGSGKHEGWEFRHTRQYSQQQGGYLDMPCLPNKKSQKSIVKKTQSQARVVKVWHEGAD